MERKYFIEPGLGKSELADYVLAIKHDARTLTIKYLKDMREEELDWQPFGDWNSIAALLAHIVAVDRAFRINFIEGRELTDLEKSETAPAMELGPYAAQFKGQSVTYYMEQLSASYTETQAAIKAMDAGLFLKRRYDDYDKIKGSDLAWILYHAAEDEIHHRGQISIIRKLYKELKAKQA